MLRKIRKRFTYTNLAVTLALLFTMSGGAYAAGRYVITSTKQISPKVLKSLQGKTGAAGAAGASGAAGQQGPAGAAGTKGEPGAQGSQGAQGPQGVQGAQGAPGTTGFTATLPAKATETGVWSLFGLASGAQVVPISFAIPLHESLGPTDVHYVEEQGNSSTCPGNAEEPKALPGNLCVYEVFTGNIDEPLVTTAIAPAARGGATIVKVTEHFGASTSGALLLFQGENSAEGYGTWAVTAPEE